jgi:hypothetical protein
MMRICLAVKDYSVAYFVPELTGPFLADHFDGDLVSFILGTASLFCGITQLLSYQQILGYCAPVSISRTR